MAAGLAQGDRVRAAAIVADALETSGRRPQSLEPLGDLRFCQVHRLQELDVIGLGHV